MNSLGEGESHRILEIKKKNFLTFFSAENEILQTYFQNCFQSIVCKISIFPFKKRYILPNSSFGLQAGYPRVKSNSQILQNCDGIMKILFLFYLFVFFRIGIPIAENVGFRKKKSIHFPGSYDGKIGSSEFSENHSLTNQDRLHSKFFSYSSPTNSLHPAGWFYYFYFFLPRTASFNIFLKTILCKLRNI